MAVPTRSSSSMTPEKTMKTLLPFAIAATLLLPAASLAADARTEYYQRNANADLAKFRELDVDRNNAITREETRGDVDFSPRFDDVDVDRDGVVTLGELLAYVEREYGVKLAGS
jgi:hypothetical protein